MVFQVPGFRKEAKATKELRERGCQRTKGGHAWCCWEASKRNLASVTPLVLKDLRLELGYGQAKLGAQGGRVRSC